MKLQRTEMDLSLAELVGECIMPRLEIDAYHAESSYRESIHSLIATHRVGGFCIFGGTSSSVRSALASLQDLAIRSHDVPLIFSADCEFGLPMRLREGGTEFPDAMAIARTGDIQNAFEVGKAIGREMRSIGLHWNFAPVADVNSNPENPIINTRSFGSEPETVVRFATAFMHGCQSAGIAATAKHFPGHGVTSVDSHKALPFVEGSWDRFDTCELPPFRALIEAGVDSVMPGHLAAPSLAEAFGAADSERDLPATLSHSLLAGLLREKLAFAGVIVTDAMEMHAITNAYGASEACVIAMQAGADIVLLPPEPDRAFQAILKAFGSDDAFEPELRKKVSRILALKREYVGLEAEDDLQELQLQNESLAASIAHDAIEVRGIPSGADIRIIIVCDDREQTFEKARWFAAELRSRFSGVVLHSASEWKEESVDRNTLLVTFHRARGYLGGVAPTATVPYVVDKIAERAVQIKEYPSGLLMIGSPYMDRHFAESIPYQVRTYSESWASVKAAATLLLQN